MNSASSRDTGDLGFFTDVPSRQIVASPTPVPPPLPPPILECSTINEWKHTTSDDQPIERNPTPKQEETTVQPEIENQDTSVQPSVDSLEENKNPVKLDIPTKKKVRRRKVQQNLFNHEANNYRRKLEFSFGDGLKWEEASLE